MAEFDVDLGKIEWMADRIEQQLQQTAFREAWKAESCGCRSCQSDAAIAVKDYDLWQVMDGNGVDDLEKKANTQGFKVKPPDDYSNYE